MADDLSNQVLGANAVIEVNKIIDDTFRKVAVLAKIIQVFSGKYVYLCSIKIN